MEIVLKQYWPRVSYCVLRRSSHQSTLYVFEYLCNKLNKDMFCWGVFLFFETALAVLELGYSSASASGS